MVCVTLTLIIPGAGMAMAVTTEATEITLRSAGRQVLRRSGAHAHCSFSNFSMFAARRSCASWSSPSFKICGPRSSAS